MAYAAEKKRLYELLTDATGITRKVHPDLEKLGDERAFEGFVEVGTGPQPDGTFKTITHPTQLQLESRLGPTWAGKGVGEIAIWKYLVVDPMKSFAEGWMNSAPHAHVLNDDKYKHWGAGIFTFLPEGEPEIARRWYGIMLVAINAPEVKHVEISDVQPGQSGYEHIQWAVDEGILGVNAADEFRPTAKIDRRTLAITLHRLYELIKSEE